MNVDYSVFHSQQKYFIRSKSPVVLNSEESRGIRYAFVYLSPYLSLFVS